MKYVIHYADGRTASGFETTRAALEALEREFPTCHAVHDGGRVLVWASEEDSVGDDGGCAVASVRMERGQ